MTELALQSSNVFAYSFKNTGSIRQRVLIPDTPTLNLGGGSFTIECWLKPDANYTGFNQVFSKANTAGSTGNYEGYLAITNGRLAFFQQASNTSSTATLSRRTWNHVAWVFNNGANVQIYLNGTLVVANASLTSITNTPGDLSIGAPNYSSNHQYFGEISNFRIIKEQAIYTGNFTIPTFPFQLSNSSIGYHAGSTNVAASLTGNVVLLTCNSDKIAANGNTVMNVYNVGDVMPHPVDTAELQNYSYFFPGNSNPKSVQNGTVLVTNSTNALNLNSDFTIETWYYPTKNTGVLIERGLGGVGGNNASYVIVWDSPNNQLNFAASNANGNNYSVGSLTGPTGNIGKPTLDEWNHVAVTRTGTTYRGFLNGSLNMNITNNANVPYAALGRGITIGGMFRSGQTYATGIPSNTISGYVSNMRIISGNSIYNAAFTPANTQLLSNSTNVILVTGITPAFEDVTGTQTLAVNGANEIFPSPFSPFTANAIANSNNSTWGAYNFGSGRKLGKVYIKTDPDNYARSIITSFSSGRRLGRIYNKNDPTYIASFGLVVHTIGNRLGRVYPKTTTDSTKFSYMPMVAPSPAANINYQFWS